VADYITITEAQSDPEAAVDSSLIKRLRDNPIAIAEGAAGAPRLLGMAAKTELEYLTDFPLSGLFAGDLVLPALVFTSFGFVSTSSTGGSYVSAGETIISARATGTLRFRARHTQTSTDAAARSSEIRLLKNGVEVAAISLTSGNNQTVFADREIDATAASGDVFEWQIRRTGTTSQSTSSISTFSVRANDTMTSTPLFLKVSEARP